MNHNSVEYTARTGLCTSCGMCINMCPNKCITWTRTKGMFYPSVDKKKCTQCGICKKVCPGLEFSFGNDEVSAEKAAMGIYIQSYNAWSKNPEIRHMSASGGIISTLVEKLLLTNKYDVAFYVDTYEYSEQIRTQSIQIDGMERGLVTTSFPKSRYLPVSHENAVAYVKKNRDKKVIFIGTSCAVRGFIKVIKQLNLNREQYLLIGLFCDKVFNYNVNKYFQQEKFCQGKHLEKFHFKNKESGGWPGNMKLIFSDGTSKFLNKEERNKIKEYFMPERCLYCIDKLNVMADISLGDNYTKEYSSKLGSNSVIVRTERGMGVWQDVSARIESHEISMELIKEAQYLNGRLNNLYFGMLKCKGMDINLNEGVAVERNPEEFERAWKNQLRMLRAGEKFCEKPQELQKQINITEKKKNPHSIRNMLERVYYSIKRKAK